MPEKAVDRVTRLLALLGYLTERDDVPIAELAEHFGVSQAQILTDIDLLWVTGLPGYYPSDLIDFSVDEQRSAVSLREGQGLARHVRLAPREAVALTAAVQWLIAAGDAPDVVRNALDSLAVKLKELVPATVEVPHAPAVRSAVSDALEEGHALVIDYVSAHDERSERTICPETLSTDGSAWYLEAWCGRARARRTFRLDRILSARVADGAESADVVRLRREVEAQDSAPREVTVAVDPAERWLVEDLPDAVVTESADRVRAEVTVTRTDWLVRLALAGNIREIDPDLARRVRERAAAAKDAYGVWSEIA